MADNGYAGDVDPAEAWKILSEDEGATLVDVRTEAEWRYVGVPELAGLGKDVRRISWQIYPDMRLNERFVANVLDSKVRPEQTVLLLCRSGQRSRHAAIALTAAGFHRCYNVSEGFEGPHDSQRHRGQDAGWKARGLPWTQE